MASVKGFFKGLGKAALKVAPIAAGFIPGVGPLASAAIGGLASGASKKLEGGSWKDALVSGGIGAGMGYGAGKAAQAVKGIGPSATKDVVGVAGKINKTGGIGPTIGNIGKGIIGAPTGGSKAGLIGKLALPAIGALGAVGAVKGMSNKGVGPSNAPVLGSEEDQLRNPNLFDAISAGRREAIRNQPFRTPGKFDYSTGVPPIETNYGLGPSNGMNRKRRRNQEAA